MSWTKLYGSCMTLSPDDAGAAVDDTAVCHFPGCTRPSRPDPATGRPAKYCEQVVDGVLHNRANAWHRRRGERATAVGGAESAASSAPVSMARATLEQRLADLPEALSRFTEYLSGVVAEVRTAGDMEAAGAEVEDAHREALAKVADADRRASAADRARRDAEARSAAAETERAEADAAAEDAIAETARLRAEFEEQLVGVRAEADAAVEAAEHRAAAAEAQVRQDAAERDEQVQAARDETMGARSAAAAAEAGREAAQEAAARERDTAATLRNQIEQLRGEVDAARVDATAARSAAAAAEAARDAAQEATERERAAAAEARRQLEQAHAEARSDREALRSEHAEQLRQLRQAGDDRAAALNAALDVAQPPPRRTAPNSPPRRPRPRRPRLPRRRPVAGHGNPRPGLDSSRLAGGPPAGHTRGGDGNTHPLILYNPTAAAMTQRADTAFGAIMDLAVGLGGTIVGVARRCSAQRGRGISTTTNNCAVMAST